MFLFIGFHMIMLHSSGKSVLSDTASVGHNDSGQNKNE